MGVDINGGGGGSKNGKGIPLQNSTVIIILQSGNLIDEEILNF